MTSTQDARLTFLFVSEDEVDPLVDLARDELRLERLPVDAHELVGGGRPRRQLHVVHHPRVAVLQPTELQGDIYNWGILSFINIFLMFRAVPILYLAPA